MAYKTPDPTTVETLSRAVCEALGWDPDMADYGIDGHKKPRWKAPFVRDQVLAYLAMRAVGATLPKQDPT